jgi:NitT/TauT family transport system substrate-binding protein
MKRCSLISLFPVVLIVFSLTVAYGVERPLEKINVGVPELSVLQSPLFVAIDAGAFKRYGMDVSVMRLTGARAIQALVGGSVQFAQGVSSRTVPSAALGGADAVLIASLVNKLLFTMYGLSEINSVPDLKGKIVGVVGLGATTDFATRAALKHFGLKPDADVAVRAMGGYPETTAALKGGIIQAGTFSPPASFLVEKMGFKKLFDMTALDIDYISAGLGVRRAYLAANRERVINFTKGMIEGVKIFKTDKNFTIPVLAKYTKITDTELLDKSYEYLKQHFLLVPYPSIKAIRDTLELLADEIPKAKGAKAEDFVDASLLKEIEASGFVDRLYGK